MNKRRELPEPLNAQERLLYAIAVRQDILIEQVTSIVEFLSKENKVAVTNHKVEEVTASMHATEGTTTVQNTPAPKKRAPRKKKAVEVEVE